MSSSSPLVCWVFVPKLCSFVSLDPTQAIEVLTEIGDLDAAEFIANEKPQCDTYPESPVKRM